MLLLDSRLQFVLPYFQQMEKYQMFFPLACSSSSNNNPASALSPPSSSPSAPYYDPISFSSTITDHHNPMGTSHQPYRNFDHHHHHQSSSNGFLGLRSATQNNHAIGSSEVSIDPLHQIIHQQYSSSSPMGFGCASASASINNNIVGADDHHHQQAAMAVIDSEKQKNNKKSEKTKMRKAKYAFQTRSQVDILDDGYRWRKYGQKAVKNNKFPRSYYRCTYQGCNVKKQVQRLSKDEGIVVTTYEGMHTHQIDKPSDNFEHILNQMQIYTPF